MFTESKTLTLTLTIVLTLCLTATLTLIIILTPKFASTIVDHAVVLYVVDCRTDKPMNQSCV